ncbi:hypothetical protein FRC0534_01126 [Corynebacterium diphtheriae]|nr:hypothetical protein FRC0534_01126 [Corynebacterium diphtheriae]
MAQTRTQTEENNEDNNTHLPADIHKKDHPTRTTHQGTIMTWKEIAERRLRLWWAGLAIGIIAGFALALIVTAPPTWINDIPTTTQVAR